MDEYIQEIEENEFAFSAHPLDKFKDKIRIFKDVIDGESVGFHCLNCLFSILLNRYFYSGFFYGGLLCVELSVMLEKKTQLRFL